MSSHSISPDSIPISPDSIPDTEGLGSGQRETARQKKGLETMAYENDFGTKAVNLFLEDSRGHPLEMKSEVDCSPV